MTYIRSKLFKDPEIARIQDVTITPLRAGRMIYLNAWNSVAPSILAASMMDVSIFCIFARKMMRYVPVYIQSITKSTGTIGCSLFPAT